MKIVWSVLLMAMTALARADLPPALIKMADTERAFARRAQQVAVREAFIEFFADESVAFEPDPTPARESLRKRTQAPPVRFQLLWEPRLGDISAAGDLGYLTGPSETNVPGRPAQYGNYFSVWKRQASGEYRVILDVGGGTPDRPPYAPGFARAPAVAMWKGSEPKATSAASLLGADNGFSAAIAEKGPAAAYRAVMPPAVHFQRSGVQPMWTRDTAVDWLNAHVKAWSTEPMKSETAVSGDLGYTWGKFTVTPVDRAAYAGYYIRVWTRRADGMWQLVAEVTTPPPPPARG